MVQQRFHPSIKVPNEKKPPKLIHFSIRLQWVAPVEVGNMRNREVNHELTNVLLTKIVCIWRYYRRKLMNLHVVRRHHLHLLLLVQLHPFYRHLVKREPGMSKRIIPRAIMLWSVSKKSEDQAIVAVSLLQVVVMVSQVPLLPPLPHLHRLNPFFLVCPYKAIKRIRKPYHDMVERHYRWNASTGDESSSMRCTRSTHPIKTSYQPTL